MTKIKEIISNINTYRMKFDLDLEQEIKDIIDFCDSFNIETEMKKIKKLK